MTHFKCIGGETGNEAEESAENSAFIGEFEEFGLAGGNENELIVIIRFRLAPFTFSTYSRHLMAKCEGNDDKKGKSDKKQGGSGDKAGEDEKATPETPRRIHIFKKKPSTGRPSKPGDKP